MRKLSILLLVIYLRTAYRISAFAFILVIETSKFQRKREEKSEGLTSWRGLSLIRFQAFDGLYDGKMRPASFFCPAGPLSDIENHVNMKDKRYLKVRKAWEDNQLRTFGELFKIIPEETVCEDLGLDMRQFNRILTEPASLSVAQIMRLSSLTGIPSPSIFTMAMATIFKSAI